VSPALELILWGFVAYLLWRILRVISKGLSSSRAKPALTTANDTSDSEPYTVDDDNAGDGGSHIELYPSQRKFVYKAWWIPGDTEQEYEYRVDADGRLMSRLRMAADTGTKSGDAPFDDRFYHELQTVRDGVVIEDAVRFIYENNSITSPDQKIQELSQLTEWHEITSRAWPWPELWYSVIKIHIGEHEARRGIRQELERLKRGLRIVSEQTSQAFMLEHDEKYQYSTFKLIDASAGESSGAILTAALESSGLTRSEAELAHFQIRSLAKLLGDSKEGNPESASK